MSTDLKVDNSELKNRVRRTKDQIAQGISLDSLKNNQNVSAASTSVNTGLNQSQPNTNQIKGAEPIAQPLKKGAFKVLFEKLLFSIESITKNKFESFEKNSDEDIKKQADELDEATTNLLNLGGWGIKKVSVALVILIILVVVISIDYSLRLKKAIEFTRKKVLTLVDNNKKTEAVENVKS